MIRWLSILMLWQCAFGQHSEQGFPYSLIKGSTNDGVPTITLPSVDVDVLLSEDSYRSAGQPFRYGFIHQVNYNPYEHGVWRETSDGGLIWQIRFISEDAHAISFEFDNFHMPQGSEMYVYIEDYNMIHGAYTDKNNNESSRFATPLIKGEVAIIEYYQPAFVQEFFSLNVIEIIHDYRDIMNFGESNRDRDCGTNVVCDEAQGYEDPINASAWLDMGAYICSGAMVNNVRQDLTPYFLTAWHCVDGDYPGTFRFYFNYETTSCSGSWASNGSYAFGSDLVAESDGMDSDWALLLIDDDIEEDWEVFYAGWDLTGDHPRISCGVHHPNGDPKKINFDNDIAYSDWWDEPGNLTHWKVNWDEGGSEGGSSGSPLFNDLYQIVGQLSGGPEGSCGEVYDLYGKLSHGWNWDVPMNRRLIDWLDPDYTGTLTLNGTYVEVTGLVGDTNLDGIINILDIIAIANLVFEGNPTNEELQLSDINGDGILNILDIVAVVNIILYG